MNCKPEELRTGILTILDANRTKFGLDFRALQFRLRSVSLQADEKEITAALEYLAALPKPFVEETRPEINRTERTWKITTDGIRYADEHGL